MNNANSQDSVDILNTAYNKAAHVDDIIDKCLNSNDPDDFGKNLRILRKEIIELNQLIDKTGILSGIDITRKIKPTNKNAEKILKTIQDVHGKVKVEFEKDVTLNKGIPPFYKKKDLKLDESSLKKLDKMFDNMFEEEIVSEYKNASKLVDFLSSVWGVVVKIVKRIFDAIKSLFGIVSKAKTEKKDEFENHKVQVLKMGLWNIIYRFTLAFVFIAISRYLVKQYLGQARSVGYIRSDLYKPVFESNGDSVFGMFMSSVNWTYNKFIANNVYSLSNISGISKWVLMFLYIGYYYNMYFMVKDVFLVLGYYVFEA